MTKMPKRIRKDTIARLIVIKFYSDFLKEWLDLYDKYMEINPSIDYNLENECLQKVAFGLLNKTLAHAKENEIDINEWLESVKALIELWTITKE